MGVWLRARAIWRQSSPEIGEDPWTTILEGSQASRRAECPFSHILSYTAYMVPALGYGEEGGNQVVDSVMGNYQIISSIVSFWTCKYTRWPRILTIRKHPKWHIYIGSRLGVPRSFQEPSVLSLYYKRRYGIASLRPIYIILHMSWMVLNQNPSWQSGRPGRPREAPSLGHLGRPPKGTTMWKIRNQLDANMGMARG